MLLPLLLLLLIVYEDDVCASTKKTILMVAPNSYYSHFAFHRKLTETLIAQDWVQHVHMLIIEYSSLARSKNFSSGPKLTLQYFNPYEQKEKTTKKKNLPKGIAPFLGAWWPRVEPRSYYLDVSITSVLERDLITEFARQKKEVKTLMAKHFDIGIAEIWDYAAFPLLQLIGVRHTVVTSNMPIPSILYDIMDKQYLQKIINLGDIPELWTTMCDDHLKNEKKEKEENKIFAHMHEKSIQVYKEKFAEMDKIFAEIFKDYNQSLQPGWFNSLLGEPFDYVEDVPFLPLSQLLHNSAHIFVNTQPFLDFPMPSGLTQKVTFIGGIALSLANSIGTSSRSSDPWLSNIIQLAEKKNGLILVSFGSMAEFEGMREMQVLSFLRSFKDDFPNYVFIIKSSTKDDHNKYQYGGNVFSKPWIPQIELLANAHTKVFISHCGINSVLEATQHGVPLLCVPLFGDQFYNAEAMAKRGAAVVLSKNRMWSDDISEKLREVLKDSYKEKMKEIKGKMAKTKPAEEFLKRMREL